VTSKDPTSQRVVERRERPESRNEAARRGLFRNAEAMQLNHRQYWFVARTGVVLAVDILEGDLKWRSCRTA
jgi:hypothetical protein